LRSKFGTEEFAPELEKFKTFGPFPSIMPYQYKETIKSNELGIKSDVHIGAQLGVQSLNRVLVPNTFEGIVHIVDFESRTAKHLDVGAQIRGLIPFGNHFFVALQGTCFFYDTDGNELGRYNSHFFDYGDVRNMGMIGIDLWGITYPYPALAKLDQESGEFRVHKALQDDAQGDIHINDPGSFPALATIQDKIAVLLPERDMPGEVWLYDQNGTKINEIRVGKHAGDITSYDNLLYILTDKGALIYDVTGTKIEEVEDDNIISASSFGVDSRHLVVAGGEWTEEGYKSHPDLEFIILQDMLKSSGAN